MDTYIESRFENVLKSKTFGNIVARFGLNNNAVLDIGCSNGEYLENFGSGSVGISIIKEEVEYGRKRGLDIRYGNIESEDFLLKEKFDVIFCNNTFEHMLSPHRFLIRIKKYLNPGGILVLGVPCIPKIVSLLHLQKFRGSLSLGHVNFFTKDTLIKTVERGGWSVEETRGFHFANPIVDWTLNLIYPHFYVVARVDQAFKYTKTRMRELSGYADIEML